MKKIAIVTDSSSGITSKEAQQANIFIIPLHIIVNDEMDILDTEVEIKKSKFFDIVESSLMKTSQASIGEVKEFFDKILLEYEEIIYYPIGPNLSSQYQSTSNFIEADDKYTNKVHIVECFAAAYALKKIVYLAKKLANTNLSAQEIITKTTAYEKTILMTMIPGNLKMLERGGRISSILLTFINILKIKILLQWGENTKKVASSRTASNLVVDFYKLLQKFTNNFKDKYDIVVLKTKKCSNNIWEACTYELEKLNLKYSVAELPNVFTAHAGLNTICFVAVPSESK